MGAFINLVDSPMFQKQIHASEQSTEDLKERCLQLYKGCKKFMDSLGQSCIGDTMFADSVEAFGGGQDDPISVSIGGPVMSKFVSAIRELSTYKEFLRSQVEHVLIDRLNHFLSIDMQDAKDSRRRFDKAMHTYDQAREKCSSLKKSSRDDVVAEQEEDLVNSKSAFDRSRFNLVNALMNIETKKKYEFLESFSAIMDAHLRYFKLGYELLRQLEPFIHQVLTYAQQSKELANIEQDNLARRIQDFRTQAELDQLHALSDVKIPTNIVGHNGIGMTSYKNIDAIIQSTAKGEVQTIKQGYLLKRSSSLRADWKRRFFVLDGHGTLFYHMHTGPPSHNSVSSVEHNNRVFGRFRHRHQRTSSFNEEKSGLHTVDLQTATIKIDAEDADLRLCFRIISPSKTYTLQAENEADRIDWMNKITGVIASLLNSHLQQDSPSGNTLGSLLSVYSEDSQEDLSVFIDKTQLYPLQMNPRETVNENTITASDVSADMLQLGIHERAPNDKKGNQVECVSKILRGISGNDVCAECDTSDPEWASLNLGVLICIECSGAHRNLGVHISKVRSITLDVKVWEPTLLDLFQALGNSYCNSVWEELLFQNHGGEEEENTSSSIRKPSPKNTIQQKEKFIHAKYVDKQLIKKDAAVSIISEATSIWEAVKRNDLREVYRLIVKSEQTVVNIGYDDIIDANLLHFGNTEEDKSSSSLKMREYDPGLCQKTKTDSLSESCLQGCSLLHLACRCGNKMMVELLLQFGAHMNSCDYHGRTPLHHCIGRRDNMLAKFLLRRGAHSSIKDGGGFSALERAMEMGAITDEELFILLTGSE